MYILTVGYLQFAFKTASDAARLLETVSTAQAVGSEYNSATCNTEYYLTDISANISKAKAGSKIFTSGEECHEEIQRQVEAKQLVDEVKAADVAE